MQSVNIHEAKTHLSRLLAQIANGESIIIARAGKPIAKIVPIMDSKAPQKSRIGFMKDAGFRVPDDFDDLGRDEIEKMFTGGR